MKNPWVIIGIIATLLIGGAIWYSAGASEAYNAGVEVKAHLKGNPEATVKLVEYSDFQCPACAQFQPYISEIVEQYGDQLSFEYRHFPLTQIHRLAEPAARAAEAAGQQGKFFEFHDMLFQNQGEWANSTNPAQFFVKYATELGLDMEEFTRHQRSSLLQSKVREQFNEARGLGFTGTPSFVLNGEVMKFETFDEFRNQIINAIDPSVTLNPTADVQFETASGTATTTGAVDVSAEGSAGAGEGVRFGI
jgi:protein-disulfide isomerase